MKHRMRITLFRTARISAKCCWCRKSTSIGRVQPKEKERGRSRALEFLSNVEAGQCGCGTMRMYGFGAFQPCG